MAKLKLTAVIKKPYLIKSKNPNFSPCLAKTDVNIMPARAPIGDKSAPKFEPITVLYTAFFKISPLNG